MDTRLLQLLLILGYSYAQRHTDTERKHFKPAYCLTHLEPREVYLQCGDHGLINLISVQLGYQDIALDDGTICSYMEAGPCLRSLPELGHVRAQCMGMAECRFPVSIMSLSDCHTESNFVQVEYQCIPGNSADFGNVIDICGDVLTGRTVSRTEGYIESLNYPNNYPSNLMCTCNITATDDQSEIVLQILDEDLQPNVLNYKGDDWLEFTTDISQWSTGRSVIMYDNMAEVRTNSDNVFLNFRSDASKEGRGFWLKYKAETSTGLQVPMQVSCGKYTPQDYRAETVCFSDAHKKELFLSCPYYGVINVLYAEHGYDSTLGDSCSPTRTRTCTLSALAQYDIMSRCMGQKTCYIDIGRRTIPSCSSDANYFHIAYQCVQDHQSLDDITDVCGDKTRGRSVVNTVGYIESLNYPHTYIADSDCTCALRSDDAQAEIILTVLDMDIAQDAGVLPCQNDWLEYVRHTQDVGSGTRMCDKPLREPIHTEAQTVYLNLHTDTHLQGRGFWLKYYARKPDGTKTSVAVTCKGQTPTVVIDTSTNSSEGGAKAQGPPYGKEHAHAVWVVASANSPKHDIKLDLIIGLAALTVVMFILLAVIIFLKYQRSRRLKKNSPPPVPMRQPSHSSLSGQAVEASYGSTYNTGFDTGQSLCSSQTTPPHKQSRRNSLCSNTTDLSSHSVHSGVGIGNPMYEFPPEPHPDYNTDDGLHSSRAVAFSNSNPAYKNPVFDDNDSGLVRNDYFYNL